MQFNKSVPVTLALALLAGTSAMAQQRTLVINHYSVQPAPKEAMDAVVAAFEAEYPDIDIVENTFDPEGYKTAIRNFLSADPPDVAQWMAGNRMAPFVDAGQFMDISDVWAENGLNESLASGAASMTMDGKQYGIPYSYYQWGIYYNKDAYAAAGATVPTTWDEFVANCALFEAAEIDCLTTGTSALWPAAGIFDYLDLRTNGYDFHMQLTNGEVAWTDDRVRAVFAEWDKIAPEYITENHAAIDWQDAATLLVQGKAANYVMGNFAVPVFLEGGMTTDNLGFMPFPTINPDVVRAEEAPTDSFHVAAGAKNPDDAKLFMAFLARPEIQAQMNVTLGQLPVNAGSTVGEDPYIMAGFELLSTTEGGIAQFFDRDAPAEMAKLGMEGFQEFMVYPENLDDILARLEEARARIYAAE